MVNGLQLFGDHFEPFQDCYIVIGGTACDLLFSEAGLEFRGTRDIDMVLLLDKTIDPFYAHFWKSIQSGQYENRQQGGRPINYYRFMKPQDGRFPYMIELFSK